MKFLSFKKFPQETPLKLVDPPVLDGVSNRDVDFSSITRVLYVGLGRPIAHFYKRIFLRLLSYGTFILVEQNSRSSKSDFVSTSVYLEF